MVFRSQTSPCTGLVLLSLIASAAFAQTYTYEVRHQHFHGGVTGTLRITTESISFNEAGNSKKKPEAYTWRYEEIQQLSVGATEIRVLTYEDSKWQFGRDREFVFDRLPRDLSVEVYPTLARLLDQRFVAAMGEKASPEWKVSAKLDRRLSGSIGTLFMSGNELVFDTKKADESRSWRLTDIENVSKTGPLDLMITTNEKSGAFRGGMRQFHFQLQQALAESNYDELWRSVNRTKGLSFLEPDQKVRP